MKSEHKVLWDVYKVGSYEGLKTSIPIKKGFPTAKAARLWLIETQELDPQEVIDQYEIRGEWEIL
tara:strand:- start:2082 stop:2276 length:195 start_codon:yes stop_codon:yes gene_type:complete